jgi:ATP-dependent Clp protease protease subunit
MSLKQNVIPSVTDTQDKYMRTQDIFSHLLKYRIIYLSGEITEQLSSLIIMQLIYLNGEDSSKPIMIYIQSPGGDLYSGLSIIDGIGSIKAPVYTVAIGFVASAAALILCGGEKIFSTKYATIMLHQPHGGAKGQTTDLNIQISEMNKKKIITAKFMFNSIVKRNKSTISFEEFLNMLERDVYFTTEEAIKLGLVDEELSSKFNYIHT